jgi:hypothetical protein
VTGRWLGAAFFAAVEYLQRLFLDESAGYSVLRAHGETFAAGSSSGTFRPWLLCILPALGRHSSRSHLKLFEAQSRIRRAATMTVASAARECANTSLARNRATRFASS